MSLRELMIEYILFAFTEQELMKEFQITEDELPDLPDLDLLELYDRTLLMPVAE
jgi:hypothetical protein